MMDTPRIYQRAVRIRTQFYQTYLVESSESRQISSVSVVETGNAIDWLLKSLKRVRTRYACTRCGT